MTELMIEADGLVKRFGTVEALAGLTLSAPSGGVLAVLGPNAAGKSTFVRTVATLTSPDAGRAQRSPASTPCGILGTSARSSASPASTPPSRRP